jgi:hypothetical protein
VKSRTLTWFTAITLFAALTTPVRLAAQHTRYNVFGIDTQDGPASYLFGFDEGEQVLNNRGAVIGSASTATPDRNDPNCFSPDCFLSSTFRWDKGVFADRTAENPTAAKEEEYQNRAYPAAYVPFKLTANAQTGRAENSDNKRESINKFRKDRDQLGGNKRALPGLERDRAPFAAAEEEYAKRAYPGKEIPFSATKNALAAFNRVKARSAGTTLSTATTSSGGAAWTLIGPSTADDPNILTFTGSEYITSGRITALAIAPVCTPGNCRVWAAAAGGGIWRTNNALSTSGPSWTFVSGSFATNAIGTLTYVAATGALYAGTGEPNASADSEAGFGIYMSTDGGTSWTHLAADTSVPAMTTSCGTAPAYSGPAFNGRSISSIVVNGSTIYVGSTRGVRGVSSVSSGGASTLAPGFPPFGLWKSTDGGASFTLLDAQGICLNSTLGNAGRVQSTFSSPRGVNHVEFDPTTPSTVYAAAFQEGVWRSTNGGSTFTQIKTPLDATQNTDRAEFATAALPTGFTRMYVGVGNTGSPQAHFYRTDDATGAAVFTDLTTSQNINYCTGQCWYDNAVISPAGFPDTVYLLGSFQYSEYGGISNGRGVLYSTDAGVSFTDETWDATTKTTPAGSCCQPNPVAPNGLHPDQHALVVSPSNAGLFFEGSDGGLMRSSGGFANISSQCTTYRGLTGADLTLCGQLLSRVPTALYNLNTGLSTLQFQSLSVAADNASHLQGGTQDNGTFDRSSSSLTWPQIIYGDGGQSGFNAGNSALRFNTFTGQFNDVNFRNGDPSKWVIATGPIINSPEGAYFYPPVIADPNPTNAGSIYQGSQSVWRTQDWAGSQAYLEANCAEFTTSSTSPACGDFIPIGATGKSDLTSKVYGATLLGGFVAAIARAPSDTGTLWVATGAGRVFISKNANSTQATVTYTRLDTLPSATAAPGRFVTSIYVDPSNPNHAWISYSGYNFTTPSNPGHVFEVTYSTSRPDATWTDLDSGTGPMGDLPVTALVRDDVTDDLYAATDFGVLRLPSGTSTWVVAGSGLPMVEVPGLTIVPSARVLYAATHGRSAWSLTLP